MKKGTPKNEETEPMTSTKHLCDLEINKSCKFETNEEKMKYYKGISNVKISDDMQIKDVLKTKKKATRKLNKYYEKIKIRMERQNL